MVVLLLVVVVVLNNTTMAFVGAQQLHMAMC